MICGHGLLIETLRDRVNALEGQLAAAADAALFERERLLTDAAQERAVLRTEFNETLRQELERAAADRQLAAADQQKLTTRILDTISPPASAAPENGNRAGVLRRGSTPWSATQVELEAAELEQALERRAIEEAEIEERIHRGETWEPGKAASQ